MLASEIMSAHPDCCTPNDTADRAARIMAERDCGCVPVVEEANGRRVVGVITDRDIAVRGVARGLSPSTKVRDLMTPSLFTCSPGASVSEVEQTMADHQVRRVIIVDDDRSCLGIVAQADLARAAAHNEVTDTELALVIESISMP